MDWIKQNKSLAGFLAFVVVVGGGLGYLAFTAKGKADEAYDAYQKKATELKTLEGQPLFPSDANVTKVKDIQKAYQAEVDALQKQVIKAQIPLKPITPEKFQDNLRESIRRLTTLAAEHNVVMPKDKFYLGFEAYQSVPPKAEIAPQLERELEAVEKAVAMLIESNISELKDIKRDPLAEEGGKTTASSSSTAAKPVKKEQKQLVERHEFQVEFVTVEGQLQKFINSLVGSKDQFYVPKAIDVANEQPQGPSKAAQPQPPDKGQGFILGDEKLNVITKIDIVNFAEPAAAK